MYSLYIYLDGVVLFLFQNISLHYHQQNKNADSIDFSSINDICISYSISFHFINLFMIEKERIFQIVIIYIIIHIV